tara:strand:+ start:49 stop:1647 length:1599 start_codon:yes stop_codon:yes gene_type:complete
VSTQDTTDSAETTGSGELPDDRPDPTFREVVAFYAMVVGMFLALVNVQIVGSSFRQIQGGLSAGPEEVSWLMTAYLIAEVVMIPLSGWLTQVMSTRWLFTACMGGFTVASLASALTWNIESMIVCRALQGFTGGALLPMVFGTLFTLFPARKQEMATILVGIVGTTAPALGPSLGGWISEYMSWHWLFLLNVPPGIVITVVIASVVRFDRPNPSLLRNIDFIGISLVAVTLATLLVVVQEGRREGWFESDYIRTLSVISAVAFVLFLWRELTARHPVVDLRAFTDRNFLIGTFFVFVFGAGIYGPVFALPLFLAQVRDLGSLQIGLIVFVIGVFQMLSGIVVYFMLKFMRRRHIVFVGVVMMAYGTYLQAQLTIDTGFEELFVPQMIRGLAAQMVFLPLVNLALGRLPASRVRNGSGLFNLTQRLGAAIGIAVASAMLQVRAEHHYARLMEVLPRGDIAVQPISRKLHILFESRFGDSPTLDRVVTQFMIQTTQREALILAFNDVMLAIAVLIAASIMVLPAIRGLDRPKGT